MKKRVFACVLVVLAIAVTSVLASGIISNIIDSTVSFDTHHLTTESFVQNVVADNIASIKDYSDFDSIINCYDEAKYNNIAEYISFMASHKFTSSQVKVINKTLLGGTTIQSLQQVYKFWLTTDEDFSAIYDICQLESNYGNLYWYEDAFNKLTKNSHGVMELEDIQEYNGKGIGNDEIMCANILSRKKGQNIYNILNRVVGGESLENIACEVYKTDKLPEGETLYQKIMLVAEADEYGIDFETDKLAEVLEKIKTVYINVAEPKIQAALANVEQPNIDYDEQQLFERIEESGMHSKFVQALYNKGFTTKEIYRVSQTNTDDYFAAAKKAREELKNE